MPDRQTFDGHLVELAAHPGDPHLLQLESTMIRRVNEAVKSAMEGNDDIERFIVVPEPAPAKPSEVVGWFPSLPDFLDFIELSFGH